MTRRVLALTMTVVAAAAAGCGGDSQLPRQTYTDEVLEGIDGRATPGLSFARVPSAARLNGRFEVWVRINGSDGYRIASDSRTVVTLASDGPGNLTGTLSRTVVNGLAVFHDLAYDRWQTATLIASADGVPGSRVALLVRPVLRFVEMLVPRLAAGLPTRPVEIELVDGQGKRVGADQTIALDTSNPHLSVEGPSENNLATGVATFGSIRISQPGNFALIWRSAGLSDLTLGVSVGQGAVESTAWLPAARVGVPYLARVFAEPTEAQLSAGTLARGLQFGPAGEIHGLPLVAGVTRLRTLGLPVAGGAPTLLTAHLPVFPATEVAAQPLDQAGGPGPFEVASLDEMVDVTSRNTTVRVRVHYPHRNGAMVEGPLPLVVFHHGAFMADAQLPFIFDRFDHLLKRWASHGFAVATIDAVDLVWSGGRLVNATLPNLTAMSENQRATITHLRARSADPTFPLAGRIDTNRVIVAGHSRGGGASLITARTEPSVIGGILIKPLDPLTTVGGEKTWNVPLPRKPFLVLIAGKDGDLPYPMVDLLYDRRAGPMSAPTLPGAVHNSSCQTCPDEPGVAATITREQEWSVTNAYAVAFLKFVMNGELGYGPLLFGRAGLSTGLSPEGVYRRSDGHMQALVVDDFQDDVTGRNELGLASRAQNFDRAEEAPSLSSAIQELPDHYSYYRILFARPEYLAWSGALLLTWTSPGATYATDLGGLDIRGRDQLALRARSNGQPVAAADLAIRLVDAAGVSATVPLAEHVGATGIGPRFSDVLVPMERVRAAAPGLDHSNVSSLELTFLGRGSLLIDDLRFE